MERCDELVSIFGCQATWNRLVRYASRCGADDPENAVGDIAEAMVKRLNGNGYPDGHVEPFVNKAIKHKAIDQTRHRSREVLLPPSRDDVDRDFEGSFETLRYGNGQAAEGPLSYEDYIDSAIVPDLQQVEVAIESGLFKRSATVEFVIEHFQHFITYPATGGPGEEPGELNEDMNIASPADAFTLAVNKAFPAYGAQTNKRHWSMGLSFLLHSATRRSQYRDAHVALVRERLASGSGPAELGARRFERLQAYAASSALF